MSLSPHGPPPARGIIERIGLAWARLGGHVNPKEVKCMNCNTEGCGHQTCAVDGLCLGCASKVWSMTHDENGGIKPINEIGK